MVRPLRMNRSQFLKVKCPDCEHEQLVFGKASTLVPCIICGRVLSEPTGGKASLKAEIIATYE